MRSLVHVIVRIAVVGILMGGTWLLLQFYTEAELLQAVRDFWAWWSTLLTGDLGTYWNPAGAAIALGAILLFVTQPLRRLFRSRSRHDSDYYDSGYDSGSDDGGADDGD